MTAVGSVMFEELGRWIPGFDPATGILALPPWAAASGAVVLALVGLFVLTRCLFALARYLLTFIRYLRSFSPRAGRIGPIGAVVRVVMVLFGATLAWFVLDGWSKRDLAAERRALDARSFELATRALMPGSALACLDAGAGDTVEASCEKALFATPEATATAVSYVAAQLALLADASTFVRRDPSYAAELVNLRRAVTSDRFGLVAHVLAARHGCTPDQCRAFALLNDASRVSSNLAERSYEFYVVRHAAGWPPIAKPPVTAGPPPVAATAPPAAAVAMSAPAGAAPPPTSARASAAIPQSATAPGIKPTGSNVFFPSSASIPPVSIMNAEPSAPQENHAPPPVAKTPTPPRRPAPPAPQTRRPVDSNTAAVSSEPATTNQ
jgi:hypothetical protein